MKSGISKLLGLLILIVWVLIFLNLKAQASRQWDIDWEGQGFEKMYVTAYTIQGITATGVPTHEGICACNTHLGDVAIVYTLDGEYIGLYECVDTGATEGLKKGTVIDIWEPDYQAAKALMAQCGRRGKVFVKWISGK